jgi:hypothetical protein
MFASSPKADIETAPIRQLAARSTRFDFAVSRWDFCGKTIQRIRTNFGDGARGGADLTDRRQ